MNRTSQFGIGNIFMTYRKSFAADETYPLYTFEWNVATASPEPLTPYFNLLRPYTFRVWMLVIVSIIVTMIIVYRLPIVSNESSSFWITLQCSFGLMVGQGRRLTCPNKASFKWLFLPV